MARLAAIRSGAGQDQLAPRADRRAPGGSDARGDPQTAGLGAAALLQDEPCQYLLAGLDVVPARGAVGPSFGSSGAPHVHLVWADPLNRHRDDSSWATGTNATGGSG